LRWNPHGIPWCKRSRLSGRIGYPEALANIGNTAMQFGYRVVSIRVT